MIRAVNNGLVNIIGAINNNNNSNHYNRNNSHAVDIRSTERRISHRTIDKTMFVFCFVSSPPSLPYKMLLLHKQQRGLLSRETDLLKQF